MDVSGLDTWRRAFERLDAILALDGPARARHLEELERSDPELHARVLAVLRGEQVANDSGFLDPSRAADADLPLAAGERVGPYRVERELGAGGTGTVWLARRDDGRFEGEVAIKMLHRHLGGQANRERFRREAMLLGKLAHPGIARILDAGSHEGSTYLVLEYVRGDTIDAWCDGHRSTVAERLQAFIAVCEAVAHAHANLVVHRDIKPSNILVTDDGQVKLLDFGIGKLVDHPGDTDEPGLTHVTGRVLTPDYAAPEQILNEAVNTSADVYSLGVLLYVLLTGARPYTSAGSSIVRIEQAVLNEEPPSLRRAAQAAGEYAAAARATTPAKLARALDGDLEHIVRRAMRKQPAERYASVFEFIDDLRRHLNHEPVRARRGSRLYRVGRFVRRYRIGVAAASAALLLIGGAVASAVWQAQIATREARRATAVKEFLLDIFNSNSERHPEGARARLTTAEELLDIASTRMLAVGAGDPELQVELLGTLASLNDTLERDEQAQALVRRQIEIAVQTFGESDRRLVRPRIELARLLLAVQQYDEVLSTVAEARALLDAGGDRLSIERANLEILEGQVAYLTVDDAEDLTVTRHVTAAVDILQKLPASKEVSEALVSALYMLSKAYAATRHIDQALGAATRGLELAIRVRGPDDILVAMGHQQSSPSLLRLGRLSEAEQHMDEAVRIFTRAVGPEGWYTVLAYLDVGRVKLQQCRYLGAVEAFERMYTARRRAHGDDDRWLLYAQWGLGQALVDAGDFSRAAEFLDRVAERSSGNLQVHTLRARAKLRLLTQRPAEALTDLDLASATAREASGPLSVAVAELQVLRAEALASLHRLPEAKAALAEAAAILDGNTTYNAQRESHAVRLGQVGLLLEENRDREAEVMARAVLASLQSRADRTNVWPLEETAQRRLADALRSGDSRQRCAARDAVVALREPFVFPADPRLLEARRLQRECAAPAT